MTVTKSKHQLSVALCKTHYGHECSLGHPRLQTSEREAIAGKLFQGVPSQHILDTIRSEVGSKFDRIHLTTRKDITNIERSFGLHGNKRHDDDATSVMLWVEEMRKTGTKSPVLVYKRQGEKITGCNLHEKDFVLGIQTPLQAEMLKTFGNNSIICIDATHGTNGYDFELITVMVVDEFGEGYPIAWCISNRTDLSLLLTLFKAIKQRVGTVSPKWIMSDDADQYYSAWVGVFGLTPQKLLCTWHVDRSWRGHLNSITDKQLGQALYHNLRVLLEEADKIRFEQLLNQTRKQLQASPETASFLKYFDTYYVTRKEQWAMCYRRHSQINTNMYVESLHRVIKYLYFKGKTNKRLDKCIETLMKYERDKAFDRLSKLEKGKFSSRISTITKRHTTSCKMSPKLVQPIDYSSWEVRSEDLTNAYRVVKEQPQCTVNCGLRM